MLCLRDLHHTNAVGMLAAMGIAGIRYLRWPRARCCRSRVIAVFAKRALGRRGLVILLLGSGRRRPVRQLWTEWLLIHLWRLGIWRMLWWRR